MRSLTKPLVLLLLFSFPPYAYAHDEKKIAPQEDKKFRSSLRDLKLKKIPPKAIPNTTKSVKSVSPPSLPPKESDEPAKSQSFNTKQLFKASKDSVVLIISFGYNYQPLGYGSGFFVGEGSKIITNYHVIKGGEYFAIKLHGGKIGMIDSIFRYDVENDLALLESSYKGKPLPLAKGKAEVGEDIIAIGNPQGLEGTLSKGLVSGIREDSNSYYYQITAPISPGSSGGPIINKHGEVIGVSTGILEEGQNLNFAVPSIYVQNLLGNSPYNPSEILKMLESIQESIKEDDGEAISLDTKDSRYASYFSRIKTQIELVWDYPDEAERKGIIGQLTLRFQVSRDGNLMNVRVIDGSGYNILDEAALQAVKSAAPYYPFPDTIDRETLPIVANFVYNPRSDKGNKDHDEKPNQNDTINQASPRDLRKPNEDTPAIPDLSGLDRETRSLIKFACVLARGDGPVAYGRCLNAQLEDLQTSPAIPDLSGLDRETRSLIKFACVLARGDGPVAYGRCLNAQLEDLQTSPAIPDLSGLDRETRSLIKFACVLARGDGPVAYGRCLNAQLESIGVKTSK